MGDKENPDWKDAEFVDPHGQDWENDFIKISGTQIPIDELGDDNSWIEEEYDHPLYLSWIEELFENQLPTFDFTDPESYPEGLDPESLYSWILQFVPASTIRRIEIGHTLEPGKITKFKSSRVSKATVLIELDSNRSRTVPYQPKHKSDFPLIPVADATTIIDLALFGEDRSLTRTWLHEKRARRTLITPEELSLEQIKLISLILLAERGFGKIPYEVLYEGMLDIFQELVKVQRYTLGQDYKEDPEVPF